MLLDYATPDRTPPRLPAFLQLALGFAVASSFLAIAAAAIYHFGAYGSICSFCVLIPTFIWIVGWMHEGLGWKAASFGVFLAIIASCGATNLWLAPILNKYID